jgi:putative endonuclease
MEDRVPRRSPDRRTPRRATGDLAEQVAARHLAGLGWAIVARNVRVGRWEIDIVAREPPDTLVFVEVRSRSGPGLGMPEESVDAGKVARLYAAAGQLLRSGGLPGREREVGAGTFRVDLVSVVRGGDGRWRLRTHLRGLAPP